MERMVDALIKSPDIYTMKQLFSTLISLAMFFNCYAQNVVYSSAGKTAHFAKEDLDITFSASTIRLPQAAGHEFAPALAAILPTVIDAGFKLTTGILEKRVKKFSAEYTKEQSSPLTAGDGFWPEFKLVRTINLEESPAASKEALGISFKIDKTPSNKLFYYYVDALSLAYSAAKATARSNTFDYVIELKINYIQGTEKKTLTLAPLVISSVAFGNLQVADAKYRTEIFTIPDESIVTGVSLKVTETNPAKTRAEKILGIWNDHKDEAKTIVNNFLPKADSGSGNGGGGDAKKKAPGQGGNQEAGND